MTRTSFKFVGPGRHYGVPARDITAEEIDGLRPRQKRIIVESAAYEATRSGKEFVPETVTNDPATTEQEAGNGH